MKTAAHLAGIALLCLTGCQDATPIASTSEFLTDTPPANPMSIAAVVDDLKAAAATPDTDPADTDTPDTDTPDTDDTNPAPRTFVIEGLIYAGEHDPFQPGTAAFLVSELPDPNHGDGSLEHAETCPFCRRKAAAAAQTMVEFRDGSGQLIREAATEMLGIQKGDHVIVEGTCTYNDQVNLVTMIATKIHRLQ